MNKIMDMTIATPEGIVFEGKVESAKFPGAAGAFMVLPKHAALISALSAGKVIYTTTGDIKELVQSINKLFNLKNKDVYSGHGGKTTIDIEKNSNPIKYYD